METQILTLGYKEKMQKKLHLVEVAAIKQVSVLRRFILYNFKD
jgi:hypothetical protein